MQLIVLGSGTSNGVPMVGYRYPQGYLDEPKNHRTRASVVVAGPTGNLLVDCAPEMRLQLTREGVYEIEATLITHTHADHVMGMDDLRSICMLSGKPMPVFTLPEHQTEIKRIFPYAFRDPGRGIAVPRFEFHDVPPVLEVGGLEFETFVVKHGRARVVAFRVRDVAYITDVSDIEPGDFEKLKGLKSLILDAVRFKPHPNHFHYAKAIEVAERIAAQTTYFTHLSHDYDHHVQERLMPANIRLAFDGLRIPL